MGNAFCPLIKGDCRADCAWNHDDVLEGCALSIIAYCLDKMDDRA
jgi:hypothetical protein